MNLQFSTSLTYMPCNERIVYSMKLKLKTQTLSNEGGSDSHFFPSARNSNRALDSVTETRDLRSKVAFLADLIRTCSCVVQSVR